MWLAYACGSAFFAGITAILAKVGIKKIDSNLATAIRTIVVLIFAWIMVRLTGSYTPIGSIGTRTLIYLTLSGIATGASWLRSEERLVRKDCSNICRYLLSP